MLRRFPQLPCCIVGLLLSSPFGRAGGLSRPNCVGVGGRSGSSSPSCKSVCELASPVALLNSDANWPSGLSGSPRSNVFPRVTIGDLNDRSEGRIPLETRLGGAANAWRPLNRLLGELLSSLRLASETSEGLRAFLSRNPKAIVSASFIGLCGLLFDELLVARSELSIRDRAKLSLAGS